MAWMSATAAREAGAIDVASAPRWPEIEGYEIVHNLDGHRALYQAECGCKVIMRNMENPHHLCTFQHCKNH